MTVKDLIVNKIAHERFDEQLDQLATTTRRRVGIQALKCTLVTVLVIVSVANLYRGSAEIGHNLDDAYDEQHHQLTAIEHSIDEVLHEMKQNKKQSATLNSFEPKTASKARALHEHLNDYHEGHHGHYEDTLHAIVQIITLEVALVTLIYFAIQESTIGVLVGAVIALLITLPEIFIVGVDAVCGVSMIIITILSFSYALALRSPSETRSPRMSMMSADESVV